MQDRLTEHFDNLPELSVSEVSSQIKRTIESTFEMVRVRGEISRPNKAASGHLYLTLKDEKAVLDGVCWRGTAHRLSIQPEEGMEVICVGKLTTYPGRSKYQMVIEQIELAGEGALLKLLEDRRKRLAAEGLFDESRKRPLPFLPSVIGVVTSPTGAVISDILHRFSARFPRHILIWPTQVQGGGAKDQIAAAIEGFNAIDCASGVPRPDLIIVARGGGSLEDLWAFNEEEVVRATAASQIPLISAVGHETDTTLIDFASDRRAPTPTAAAEIAIPVRSELLAQIIDAEGRLLNAVNRFMGEANTYLDGLNRGLGDPQTEIESRTQTIDYIDQRLAASIKSDLDRRILTVVQLADRLPKPETQLANTSGALALVEQRFETASAQTLDKAATRLDHLVNRFHPEPILHNTERAAVDLERANSQFEVAINRALAELKTNLMGLDRLLEASSFERTLDRGFVVVRDQMGTPVMGAEEISPGQVVSLKFRDGDVKAVIRTSGKRVISRGRKSKTYVKQDSLF